MEQQTEEKVRNMINDFVNYSTVQYYEIFKELNGWTFKEARCFFKGEIVKKNDTIKRQIMDYLDVLIVNEMQNSRIMLSEWTSEDENANKGEDGNGTI